MHDVRKFFESFPTKKFKKGDLLLDQNEAPKRAFAVKKGVVRTYNLTEAGEEKSLGFKVALDIFPFYWIFSQADRALFFYQAHTDVEAYILSREELVREIERNPRLASRVIANQAGASINSELQIEALEQSRASLKVLYTLRHLALMHGATLKNNLTKISIPFTQQELANFIGLTRETTALELNRLRRMGVVAWDALHYFVDPRKMNELISDGFNPGVKPISA